MLLSQTPASVTVTGTVVVRKVDAGRGAASDSSNAVIWLKPIGTTPNRESESAPASRAHFEIRQQHRRFEPHVLAIPVGAVVAFPNLDPFFHNVFSMYHGKRFDLGLYESGTSHSVTFDRPGIVYVFCNIHPEMSAVVIALEVPYFAMSNRSGQFTIADVPPGRYLLSVWHERGKPEVPSSIPREVTISAASASIGPIVLLDSGEVIPPHKNKYGRDYEKPAPGVIYK